MGIYTYSVGGFGFKTSPDELKRLDKLYGDDSDMDELLSTGSLSLPDGFAYAHYNDGYDEPAGMLFVVKSDDAISAALRGEAPLPDMTPLVRWARKHLISFDELLPKLHHLTYTC
jgi:hypothetical protein